MTAIRSLTILVALILNEPLWAATFPSVLEQDQMESHFIFSGDRERAAKSLYEEAERLTETGQYGLARLKLLAAVRIWQQARQPEMAAQALRQLAERDHRAGRWQAALQSYRQLLQLKPISRHDKVIALNSIAQIYGSLHQFHYASNYFRRALSLAQQISEAQGQSTALIGLAIIYAAQRDDNRARACLDATQKLNWRAGSEQTEGDTFYLIGQSYREQGQVSEARQAFGQAQARYRRAGDQAGEALSFCALSEAHLAAGQPNMALEQATQAVTLARRLKDSEPQWRAWLALARAQRAIAQIEQAINSYFRAIGFIEKQRLLALSADSLRIALLAERQAPYRELAALLLLRGSDDEAFRSIEHARARATLDLLAHPRRDRASVDSNGAHLELAHRIARLRSEIFSSSLSREKRDALQAELVEAEQRLEEARWEIESKRLKRFTRPVTLKQAQETLLRPQEALLEFFLGEERSYVWLISATESRWADLPGQREIEAKVRPYLETLSLRPHNLYLERALVKQRELGEQVFRLLLGPLAERLKTGQQLLIMPDGLLYYLPFETLIRDGRYLIEDHEISYAPSASVLSVLRSAIGHTPGAPGPKPMALLAFGDAVFAPPLRAKISQRRPSSAIAETLATMFPGNYGLPPLPHTRAEVLAISELLPLERQRIYLGAMATERSLKLELLSRYRWLHFATHSLIDEHFPARSGVVLTLDKNPAEDNFLEMREIAELELDCDLVVLSACQTGRGQLVTGEGIVGLSRAFLYAGAHAVAVSLWDVSDAATARFMSDFYRHLVSSSNSTASLRQAKLESLRSNQVMRHPYYWAPFVIVGNPQ